MARFMTSSIATGDALVRPRTGGARSYFVAKFMQFLNKKMTARRKRFSYPPCPVPHRGEGSDQEKSAPAWRRSIEQQFHCKPNEAVGPAHVMSFVQIPLECGRIYSTSPNTRWNSKGRWLLPRTGPLDRGNRPRLTKWWPVRRLRSTADQSRNLQRVVSS
jgi:hypothetical protein